MSVTARIIGKPSGFRVALPARRGRGRTLVAKSCIKCGDLKTAAEFPLTGSSPNPNPTCRDCYNASRRGADIELPPRPWGRTVIAASCRVCHRLLDASAFPMSRKSPDWQCRDCAAHRTGEWGKQNPDRVRRHRDRQRAEAERIRQAAERRGYDWTGPEIEIAMRTDLTIPEAARLLRRTVHGVRWVRRQVEVDPRKQNLL